MKLYFLTGLPTETDEDTLGIAELARNVRRRSASSTPSGRRCTVSVGGFVPKPHTPFQWFGQNTVDELQRKVNLLRDATRQGAGRAAQVARPGGDVRRGHRQPRRPPDRPRSSSACGARGGTFQEWSEHFDLDRWHDAMARRGPRPRLVRHPPPHRGRGAPWDHISAGLHKDFLWQDWQDAPGRARPRGLPVDALLRLRGVHRLRHRARRGLGRRRPPAAARAPARTSAVGGEVPVTLLGPREPASAA